MFLIAFWAEHSPLWVESVVLVDLFCALLFENIDPFVESNFTTILILRHFLSPQTELSPQICYELNFLVVEYEEEFLSFEFEIGTLEFF